MNPKKYVENRIHGWFPEEPEKRAKANLSSPTPPVSMFFRVGGLLLSTVGVFLMAMALFSSLLFVSGYNLLSNLGTLLDVALIAGITFAVVGMTLTAHSMQSNAKFLRRPCLIAGLTLVTLSVFYSILIVLEATWMAPYQFGALIQPY